MLGLYFADEGQHLEHRLFADHNAPKTKSNVVYKGALQGKGAHTVWIGNVLIRKVAEGIETYEENRNLVLTDGCQADSVPNLEIETGEIEGAGHASATARFDDEQAVLPALARHLREGGAAPGGARLLQRPDPQGRHPLHRGPACWRRSRRSSPRTCSRTLASWRRHEPSSGPAP
ncbi:SufD family Fe-S cluster assembly protein [Nocardioides convexus]|uniref:SufB/SufD family protein n=1 Tax=Nocardioides convexus TaxID=2712224 RepID=UPI002418357A|nr:SufD family Fe-S cluster assembly protein [Nocardioides convexus]